MQVLQGAPAEGVAGLVVEATNVMLIDVAPAGAAGDGVEAHANVEEVDASNGVELPSRLASQQSRLKKGTAKGMSIRESTANPVTIPSFSVHAQGLPTSVRQRALACSISSFREIFAFTLTKIGKPDDIDVLLELCSDLMTIRKRANVELECLSKISELTAEQNVDISMAQVIEARMATQAARLADLIKTRERDAMSLEECSANMHSLESHLLSVKEVLEHMEEATARVSTGVHSCL
ncbi:hypothetical protein ACLOJK_026890 [Asimina triloba]